MSSAEWRRLCDRCDDATTAICAVEDQIADHMEASILALAAIIIAEARNLHEPVHERVFLASLVAIRPQLVLMLLDSPLVS